MFVGRLQLLIASAAAVFICLLITLAFGATPVPEEVEVLKEIAKTLGKNEWNFSDLCNPDMNWRDRSNLPDLDVVTCNCSYESDTTCHVISIALKSQNLQGTLPTELVGLPYLQEFDVTLNYLSGNIPPIWGTMQLEHISLYGNRISGTIPKEIGNISTLGNLNLDFNQLSGSIPPELGNLSRLENFTLASNNWTGGLPETFAKLTSLKIFRICDSNFVGSIPNFIQNWKNLDTLEIQGSGLSGPIPPGIASLTNLTDLRISDLNGSDSNFPNVSQATNLKVLILRRCNIVGQLPDYFSSMTQLQILDLSFNKLHGQIPSSYTPPERTKNIYLTGNNFTGPVPPWMLNKEGNFDISYNHFNVANPEISRCGGGTLNLFGSSLKDTTLGIVSCSKTQNLCSQKYLPSLHINCGGGEEKIGDTTYEGDTDTGGSSLLYTSGTWSSSRTGRFMGGSDKDIYIKRNNSRMSGRDSQLYMNARVSPLSLTYYGFCLLNGTYTVKLHFAEIMFTDDRTYSSLGRRIFDIYIQGNLVWKDFNIEEQAGGVNIPIVKNHTVNVTDNTLEIRFYWAGKGTTEIPSEGTYGPLISAISVENNFPLPSERSLSVGAILGIVFVGLFTISLVLVILWWKGCMRHRGTMAQELRGLDLQTGSFTLRQINMATNNFDVANKIGEGGFGPVYKGDLSDGTVIAVKQLSSKSGQGNREFLNEIGMISALNHPNLVKLYGCCIEGNQLLLVYEYMENNSLARALFGFEELQLKMDWPTRHKICVGIARGLAYLHEESRLKIVHRDIKATNVLLDKELNPKISDFGLAKLHEEENTHISTRVAGTFGYMAPEYALWGYLTDKADVYSFGVVLLEIVSGKSNTSIKPKEDCFNLLDLAHHLKKEGGLMELVDSRMEPDFNKDQVMSTVEMALLCTNASPTVRPSMSTVVSMLEGRVIDQKLILDSSALSSMVNPKEITDIQHLLADPNKSQSQSMSIGLPFTASSTSTSDLYSINSTTDYSESRL